MVASQYMSVVEIGSRAYGILYKWLLYGPLRVPSRGGGLVGLPISMCFEVVLLRRLEWAFEHARVVFEHAHVVWLRMSVLLPELTKRLKGLDFLHANGVTHKDLRSENSLMTSGGTCKLVDFGLSGFYS
ncbi:hypothetical protein U0070_012304 [Myodes glareolus]|uniref:Protein kinase domain-containing protein n=1 Tax=Myodes glareolus TaxID=447135 RepID=A0AAW0HJA7_MYOGA